MVTCLRPLATALALLLAAEARAQASLPGASLSQPASQPPANRIVERAWPPIPEPLYYLDGQPLDSGRLRRLSPPDIASVQVLKGAAAAAFTPAATGRGIVFITSKRRQGRRPVRALDQRVRLLQRQYAAAPPAATGSPPAYPQPPGTRYYLNGQLASRAAVDTISGRRVRSFRTLRGPQAATYAHDASVTEAFILETIP